MKDVYDFEIPEWNRIGAMMRDLMEPSTPAARRSAVRKTSLPLKAKSGRKLGSYSLSDYVAGVNWSNAQGYASPLAATTVLTARTRLGAVKVSAFIESTNWRNALDGPQLIAPITSAKADPNAGPPPSVEDFFDTMKWD